AAALRATPPRGPPPRGPTGRRNRARRSRPLPRGPGPRAGDRAAPSRCRLLPRPWGRKLPWAPMETAVSAGSGQQRVRVAGLAAAAAATGYVALVDPGEGGVFPLCPSQA